jgi:hypothetical protein
VQIFYQPFFSNFPLAILLQQSPSSNSPFQKPLFPQKASHIQKAPFHQKTKSLTSFSKSFILSGKQGSGATGLGEGHEIVTTETCHLPI